MVEAPPHRVWDGNGEISVAHRMELEVVVVPDDEGVRSKVGDAPGWPDYAAELRGVLSAAIAASGVDTLQIDALSVPAPLPQDLAWLRNGVSVPPDQAVDLFVEMMRRAAGPGFRLLGADVLRIAESWDGVVFLSTTREVYDALDDLPEEHLEIGWRPGEPDVLNIGIPVEAVADGEFWARVRASARHRTTLLSEQWAFGPCGSRWFLLTPDNVDEVIAAVEPGSLVSAAVDPDLRVRLLGKSFTAFTAPLEPGELGYRHVPCGVDDDAELAEVTGAGFDLFLSDDALADLYAVVPDPDGVVRRQWDDPKQFL